MTLPVSENTVLGLAAACRALGDPTVKPSLLQAAIKDGRLDCVRGDFPGGLGVRIADIRKMQAASRGALPKVLRTRRTKK